MCWVLRAPKPMVVHSAVRWHTGDEGLHCVVVTPHMLI